MDWTVLVNALIQFLISRINAGFPIIQQWLNNLFNKTSKFVDNQKKVLPSTEIPTTPAEFTAQTVSQLNFLASRAGLLQKRYFKFLARVAPKFSDEAWDQFMPKAAKAETFEIKNRIVFDERESGQALNEILSSM